MTQLMLQIFSLQNSKKKILLRKRLDDSALGFWHKGCGFFWLSSEFLLSFIESESLILLLERNVPFPSFRDMENTDIGHI